MAKQLSEVDTPALILDLDRMEQNIKRMSRFAKECGVSLRPHVKTHKSPEIAKIQLAAGSKGVCLQKVSEVEVFAAAGIGDIFLTNEVIVPEKLERLARVAQRTHVGLAADDVEVVKTIGKVFRDEGASLDVYVDVDTGMGRCGVQAKDAARVAKEISRQDALVFKGIMGYEGNVNGAKTKDEQVRLSNIAMEKIVAAKRGVKRAGLDVEVVSVGSSVSSWINAKHPATTEIQPGMYALNDHVLVSRGVATMKQCALTVIATVMSKPASDRAVVDAGSKAFNFDTGLFPIPLDREGVVMEHFSEEHGWLHLTGKGREVKIGDRIRFVPAHCCTAVNQHERFVGIRGERVERMIPVLARGKML
ncbi:MAG: alanine racemase [Thaumarchaeota archaeon]|nr:alanine racemase [Nitrososphaerota archaeon]